jgi:hypothetical protein
VVSRAIYHAHHRAEAAAVAAAHHAGHLGLHEELHDRHRGGVDRVLLVPAGGAAGRVEQVARLAHRHADELRLHPAAAAAARGGAAATGEHLERLHRRGRAHRARVERARVALAVRLRVRVLDLLLVDGFTVLLLWTVSDRRHQHDGGGAYGVLVQEAHRLREEARVGPALRRRLVHGLVAVDCAQTSESYAESNGDTHWGARRRPGGRCCTAVLPGRRSPARRGRPDRRTAGRRRHGRHRTAGHRHRGRPGRRSSARHGRPGHRIAGHRHPRSPGRRRPAADAAAAPAGALGSIRECWGSRSRVGRGVRDCEAW